MSIPASDAPGGPRHAGHPLSRRALLALLPATACDTALATLDVAEAEGFLRTPLPAGARAAHAAAERGIDTLLLLGFEAQAPATEAWSAALMAGAASEPEPSSEALLGPGQGLGWWPRALPEGARLLAARRADNRVLRLMFAPLPEGWQCIRLVAFSL